MLLRFADQPLPSRPHIAVLFADKIGGFVAATPLLRGLHEKYPGCTVDYFGGELTRELEESCAVIDSRVSLYGGDRTPADVLAYMRRRRMDAGGYDLAINLDVADVNALITAMLEPRYVCGRSLGPGFRRRLPFLENDIDPIWEEEDWNSPAFLEHHRDLLSTGFIGEIFCLLAYVHTDFTRFEVPRASVDGALPDILISTSATRTVKRWLTDGWKAVIAWCASQGLSVGLLGNHPDAERRYYGMTGQEEELLATTPLLDLRGRYRLPQVAEALARARACVSIDSGIMHLAAAVGTPTLAIFGNMASPRQLWAPPVPNLRVVTADERCGLCEANRFLNKDCLRADHICMALVTPDRVIDELRRVL